MILSFKQTRNLLSIVLTIVTASTCQLGAMKRAGDPLEQEDTKRPRITTEDNQIAPVQPCNLLVPFVPYETARPWKNFVEDSFPQEVADHIFVDLTLICLIDYLANNCNNSAMLFVIISKKLQKICGPSLSVKILKMALQKAGTSFCDIVDANNRTVLHYANKLNDMDSIKTILLAEGQTAFDLFFMKCQNNMTALPLHLAAENNSPEDINDIFNIADTSGKMLSLFLMSGARETNQAELPVLHRAAILGYANIVTTLLGIAEFLGNQLYKEVIFMTSTYGSTALDCAVSKNHLDVAKIILTAADKLGKAWKLITKPNCYDNTSLLRAQQKGNVEMIKLLESYNPKKM